MKKLLCFLLMLVFLTMPASASVWYYSKPEDTLFKLSLRNHVSLSSMRAYNPTQPRGNLPEGTRIYIPISPMQANAMEREVVRLVNAERRSRGLSPLRQMPRLSKAAQLKAEDLRDKNYFDHTSPTYGTPFDLMKRKGIKYSYAGENLAKGQTTAQDVFDGWMHSKGHRENILNPNFTKIGVACCDNVEGPYWVQMFVG